MTQLPLGRQQGPGPRAGQGHFTSFAQLVAEPLGVAAADVDVITGDTAKFNWGTGTFASRGAVVAGNACHAAALAVRKKVLMTAAAALGGHHGAQPRHLD